MPRSEIFDKLSPKEKYEIFRNAYSRLNALAKSGDFLSAHVIAFSILEDRVLAARLQCYELANNNTLNPKIDVNKIPFDKSVKKLLEIKVIDEKLHKSLLESGDERNEFFHQAMWVLAKFNLESINQLKLNINALEKQRKIYLKSKVEH